MPRLGLRDKWAHSSQRKPWWRTPSEPPQRVRPSFKGTTITLKAQKKSSKTSVAVVSKTGRITAKGKSKATITITIGAKTFKCVVTVK